MISLPSSVFFSFSFRFFFFCTLPFHALFHRIFFFSSFLFWSSKSQCNGLFTPIVLLFKNTGLKNYICFTKNYLMLHKNYGGRQKLVYVNNQKSVGRTDGILACYIKLYKVTTYMTTYGHHIFVGHLTFH